METRITTGTFIALTLGGVLAYAAPQQTRHSQQQTPPHTGTPPGATGAGIGSERNGQTMTITGCLRQGAAARSFVLTQTPGTSVPNGGVGTAGGRDQRGNRYELVPSSGTDLSKMVGRQVQVTGMAVIGPATSGPASSGAGGSGAGGSGTAAPGTAG